MDLCRKQVLVMRSWMVYSFIVGVSYSMSDYPPTVQMLVANPYSTSLEALLDPPRAVVGNNKQATDNHHEATTVLVASLP